MNTKSMMRVMLFVLAGIGAMGMLAIFFPGNGITGRLFGTALMSGIAIGLVMGASKKLEIERWRDGALLAMGVIISSFGLCILGLWSGLFGFIDEWKMFWTAVALAGCGMAAVSGVVVSKSEAGRWSGLGGVICSIAAFAMFTLAIWGPTLFSFSADKLGMTGLSIGTFGGLAMFSMYGLHTSKGALWWVIRAGVLAAGVGFVIVIANIWFWDDLELAITTQLLILAAVFAHANMVCRVTLIGMSRYVLGVTLVSAAITAACFILHLQFRDDMYYVRSLWNSTGVVRVGAGFGILTVCGTLALIVMQRMSRNVGVFLKKAEYTTMHVRCPHCETEQDAPIGESGCLKCGMQFGISMRKPQCAGCGYETLGVQGGACPECGEKLPPRGVRLGGVGEAGEAGGVGGVGARESGGEDAVKMASE